jgi:hypothetical protein
MFIKSVFFIGLFVSVSAFARPAILVKLEGPAISTQNLSESSMCSGPLLGFLVGKLLNREDEVSNYLRVINGSDLINREGLISGSFDQKSGNFRIESKNRTIEGKLGDGIGRQTLSYKNRNGETVCKFQVERSIQTRFIEVE